MNTNLEVEVIDGKFHDVSMGKLKVLMMDVSHVRNWMDVFSNRPPIQVQHHLQLSVKMAKEPSGSEEWMTKAFHLGKYQ